MKPDYNLIRDKELHFLENARELFEKDRANGDGAMSAKENFTKYHNVESELGIDDIDRMLANDEIHLDPLVPEASQVPGVAVPPINVEVKARPGKESTRGSKRKRSMSSTIAEEIMQVTSSMKEIASAIKNSNQRIYAATELSAELKKLGLDKWEVMEALDFLKDNEHLVERFFACDEEIKLAWLKRKMGYNEDI
ncbi:unnamed protein product [Linum trigynum]|uniref:Uncharacterized protein n=1 Tax=Linum trigynum TaxID=586398 RepID=A0AAV2GT77_9ROSI